MTISNIKDDLNNFLKNKEIKENMVEVSKEEWNQFNDTITKYQRHSYIEEGGTKDERLKEYSKGLLVGGIYIVTK